MYIDIGERNEKNGEKKMYEKDDADPQTFKSKRTGRGLLTPGWQKRVEPVMCAYKLVTAEFDYWPLASHIEPFMHTYEQGIFLNANRSMFCWIDDWHGKSLKKMCFLRTNIVAWQKLYRSYRGAKLVKETYCTSKGDLLYK